MDPGYPLKLHIFLTDNDNKNNELQLKMFISQLCCQIVTHITFGDNLVTPLLHKTSPFVPMAQTAMGASSEPTRSTCIEMSRRGRGPISSHGPVVTTLHCLKAVKI